MHTPVEVHPRRYFIDILQIVDGIYAAACGEAAWDQTVDDLCRVGRLDGCALSTIDRLERRHVVLASNGLSRAAEPNAVLCPMPSNALLTDSVLRSSPGTIWQNHQIMSDALPSTISFWTGRMQPNDLASWACVIIGRDQRQTVYLEVRAGAGRASSHPALDDFLRQLAPHLTRAWRLAGASGWTPATPLRAASPYSPIGATPAPDLAALPGVLRLRAEFGLTKAEARLALRVAEGSSLASAAKAFNVKLTTIRSQLQQVFAKTGTSRQTELVALLLSRGHGPQGELRRPARRQHDAAALAGC
jgi:DNA-binding CsgD family transcriptional regulator